MLIKTTISFILGKNVIYQTSCKQELFDYESSKGDIYEEFENNYEDKKSLKISKKRYFNKGQFLIKIKQYKYKLIFQEYFNEPVVLPKNLTHLTFGWNFNQQVYLPKTLTHLTFGSCFNQPVDLPEGLTHLEFSWNFNQPIDLPEGLTHLTFGNRFNQPIVLPKSLTHLTFGSYFNQLINLPEGLIYLTFGSNFNQSVELPKSLTYLIIWKHQKDLKVRYNNEIIEIQNLPITINYLDLPIDFNFYSYY